MTARDLEAENVLYQPQAKVYRGSCAVGPCLVLAMPGIDPLTWSVSLSIMRAGTQIYAGTACFADLNRTFNELIAALYRDTDMPGGAVLCTGTGIIPPPEARLQNGDVLHMSCPSIGTLTNSVVRWQ
jgi:2-dehydro-3-deoxy-D-arabinonate dehydratase